MSANQGSIEKLRIQRDPEKKGSSYSWIGWLVLVAALLASAAFWSHSRAQGTEVQTVAARAMAVSGVDRTILNASGYVTARRQATVSAKVTGKVMEVLIEEGMKVKQGQILARLDDSNVKNNLDVAQAQLESTRLLLDETRAQLKQADLEFERDKQLASAKFLSQSDLDKAESDAMTLRARIIRQQQDIATAEQQVVLWKQQIEDMVIRAPFDGVVTTKDAQPGEMISPVSAGGGFTRTGIGTIVDMDSREIELDVNENYINRVEPGQPAEATLDAYPEWKIPCHVIAIIPAADRQKSTVKVRVGFDKLDPRILPDESVKVAFRETTTAPTTVTHGVLIPKSALLNQDGHDIVFLDNAGHAERRAVTVSDTQGDDAVVIAGVASGEMVIVNPPATLKDGMSLKEKKS
jgi:RND family efflux transporter MFP subunit